MGDPTLLGWLTVLLYAAAAYGCLRRAVRLPAGLQSERALFAAFALLCLAFGLNKQLDLQSPVIQLAKRLLSGTSLGEHKVAVQLGALGIAGVLVVCAGVLGARLLAEASRRAWVGAGGVASLGLFGFLRALRFGPLGRQLSGTDGLDAALEIGGVLLILASCVPGPRELRARA